MIQGQFRALVMCGPSGSGKSTLLQKLFEDFPDNFGFSVSHTTRSPRPGEVNGEHYYFTSKEKMEMAIENGEFLESAVYSGNLYGTSKRAVEDVIKKGKICVLDIDVQGVKQIKNTDLKAFYVFIKPPSLESLAERLRNRGTENEETLSRRLEAAKAEIEYGNKPENFNLVVINENVDKAYKILKESVIETFLQLKSYTGSKTNSQEKSVLS